MNLLDRAIAYVAPAAALRRTLARSRIATMTRAGEFEAASKTRRTAGWIAPESSAATATGLTLATLRARSRQLTRDNQWAKAALEILDTNIVGAGIRPTALPGSDASKRAVELWHEWAGSTDCDAEGHKSFAALLGLAVRSTAEAGEVVIRRRPRRTSDGLTVPLQLQLLEPDHLDTTRDRRFGKDQPANTKRTVQGVELDKRGRRIGYWLFTEHPGDAVAITKSVRVRAGDVIHHFRPDRIGQVRGVPWGASCLVKLKDLDAFDDATLVRQVVAAMLVGFVRDIDSGSVDGAGTALEDKDPLKMEPGTWEELPAGKSMDFSDPPAFDGWVNAIDIGLHAVASGYGVTYEDLAGDYRKVNFSSARLGRQKVAGIVDAYRERCLIPQVCRGVWRWFLEAALLAGQLEEPAGANWQAPAPKITDPKAEIAAAKERVRNGFSSLSMEIQRLGGAPSEVLEELEADLDDLARRDLPLDCDTRQTTPAGAGPREDSDDPPEEPPADDA